MFKKPLNYRGSNDKWMYDHHRGRYDEFIGRMYGKRIEKRSWESGYNNKWRRFYYPDNDGQHRFLKYYNLAEGRTYQYQQKRNRKYKYANRLEFGEGELNLNHLRSDAREVLRRKISRRHIDNYKHHIRTRRNLDANLADGMSSLNILPKDAQQMIRDYL